MDRSVPPAAARILSFIGFKEAPAGYDTLYRNGHKQSVKKLTEMTLGEVIAHGKTWTRAFGSSACGRYQFMNATLRRLSSKLKLSDSMVFTPDLQDRLGYELLKERGYNDWWSRNLSDNGFALRLSMEWASFPVPYDTKGQHRSVKKGESYYAGDALNHAYVKVDEVLKVLAEARSAGNSTPSVPEPSRPTRTAVAVGTVATGAGAGAAALGYAEYVPAVVLVVLVVAVGLIVWQKRKG